MDKVIDFLIQMQSCDDIIGEKEALLNQLPEQLNSLKENLAATTQVVEDRKLSLEDNLKKQKMKELEIKSNQEKINRYKNQLLTIQTNREYKALNSEVTHLEMINTSIDDEIIELMEAEHNLREQLSKDIASLGEAQKQLNDNEDKLRLQIKEVEKNINEVRDKRNKLAENVPVTIVKRYAALIKHKNRKAVVFEIDGSCSGCHYVIRPQQIIEINNKNQLVGCENCGRILVAKPVN